VFPFGHGLTYTTFRVSPTRVASAHSALVPDALTKLSTSAVDVQRALSVTTSIGSIALNVTNVGSVTSRYSVLLFVQPIPSNGNVGGTLTDFVKVRLQPGQSTVVSLHVNLHAVLHHTNGGRSIRRGKYTWRVEDLTGTFVL